MDETTTNFVYSSIDNMETYVVDWGKVGSVEDVIEILKGLGFRYTVFGNRNPIPESLLPYLVPLEEGSTITNTKVN